MAVSKTTHAAGVSAGEERSCLQEPQEILDEVEHKLAPVLIILKSTMSLLSFVLSMQRSGFVLQ